jgi:tRNA-dihydrouridine synthase 3
VGYRGRVSDSPFAGRRWLAPLTRGGHLAFRRLCVEFGAEVTVGEMVVVHRLLKNESSEFALLKSHASEPLFGVQLADRRGESLAEGGRIAQARGARFVDLNCGCPIDRITRRGLGASLLRKPRKLGRLVEALRRAVTVPVTVKLRTGWSDEGENVSEVARVCEEAGASAIIVHARTRNQRYSRPADWGIVGRVAGERGVPVVGNGDILTHYEARDRMRTSGVTSVMVARGALIKPWIFKELREGRCWLPSPEERVGVLWRFVELLREHFGADARGERRIGYFLPWHLDFFSRYRPLPEETYLEPSRKHPLLQTRLGLHPGISSLEALLVDPRAEVHGRIASALLAAASREEALESLRLLAASIPDRGEGAFTEVSTSEVAG